MAIQAHGQWGTFSGIVSDEHGNPLVGASVSVGDAMSPQLTDQSGAFSFTGLSAGSYTLKVTYIGYTEYTETIRFDGGNTERTIRLSPQSTLLEGATVTGKTETQQVREQAIRAVVVDTRAVAEQPTTLSELMNRSPGIRIRQSGGLGSRSELSINGFQGRAIRYFKDGIPLDYLGDGFSIANIPLNLLERVEVYKGALPISLGGDAIGGAINIVSLKPSRESLTASYEIASFNTHKIAFSAFQPSVLHKNDLLGLNTFFNYSANDYDVIAKVTDPQTLNQTDQKVRLFNNSYRDINAEIFWKIQGVNWADDFNASFSTYHIFREQQHEVSMTDPYGAIHGRQYAFVPSLRYQKRVLNNRLAIDQFIAYSANIRTRIDTVSGYYDWYGEFFPVIGRTGESRAPSDATIHTDNFTNRTNVRYYINDTQSLEANYVYTTAKRYGSDPLGLKFQGTNIDILSEATRYSKQVFGLMYESKWLKQNLTNQLSFKYFLLSADGIEVLDRETIRDVDHINQRQRHWGVGNATKLQFNPHSFLRLSVEYAYRLPELDEVFGDGNWIAQNFEVKPEKSLNLNLGFRQQRKKYTYEINTFYRRTRDLIQLVSVRPPFSQYQNIDQANGFGLEGDLSISPTKNSNVTANFTYQNLRNVNKSRLRNTPYFFANIGLAKIFDRPFGNTDEIKLFLFYNFIREFYLTEIPRRLEPKRFFGLFGTANLNVSQIIPNQHLLSLGFSYRVDEQGKYRIGGEIKNLTNAAVYDFFRVQKAGRSFHLKVTYQI